MRRRILMLLLGLCAFATDASGAIGWTDHQSFTSRDGHLIHYYLYVPAGPAAGTSLPLVLWLHGGLKSNGRGGPNMPAGAFYKDEHQAKQPCFVLRPVAVKGQNWVSPRGAGTGSHAMPDTPSPSMAALIELLDKTVKEHPVDNKNLHVVGASMGGYGVWDLVGRHPDRFASAIPICGGADPGRAGALRHMKIWMFHSVDDRIVPVRGSREMFDALMKARGERAVVEENDTRTLSRSADGRIRYTEFKGGGHNAWDRALGDAAVVSWVFSPEKR